MGNLFSFFGSKKSNQNKKSISYTQEFPYLPSYDLAQLNNYTPATTENPFASAEYLIQNEMDTQVYEKYRSILIDDGWTITEEMPVTKFSANKGNHEAKIWIVIVSSTNDLFLRVTTK